MVAVFHEHFFHRSISSVKGELVPYLVKTQFRKKKKSTFNFGSDVASVSVGDPRENKTGTKYNQILIREGNDAY